jgi:2',3'-cyclic-nucleotide 2'-phosphodiesterase (5'-nucleotidase family)
MGEIIHIYHTNDLHSHFSHWPSIRAFLHERKRWHEEAGDTCLILDIGDHVDRSHPFTEGTAGKGNVELLNEAEYDAVTIGNNEGITLSKDELDELYVQANFDVIVSNLYEESGARPKWAKPFEVLETAEGLKIGLVGATAEFTSFYQRLGWNVTDAKEAIIESVGAIKDTADFIICLSHLGIREDEQLAELCLDIDVILGAHTHHIFHEGKKIGNSLLGAAGKYGMFIGHITFDPATCELEAELIETAELRSSDEGFNDELIAEGKSQMSEPIFYNEKELKAEWFKGSELAELFGEAMLEYSGADCALFNAGLFMEGMPVGTTTRYDFHKMLPHPINLCLVELTGAELNEIFHQSLNDEWPNIELKGMGFRGTVLGNIVHVNMEVKEKHLYVGGNLADPEKVYQLITLDMFTFGSFFPGLKGATKTYFMPEFLRDVFSGFFQAKAVK